MIAVIINILSLKWYTGFVVVQKDCLSWFKDRHSLSVNSSRVEEKGRTSRTSDLDNHRLWDILNFAGTKHSWVLFAMAALDVMKCTSSDVSKVYRKFHLSRNIMDKILIVPGVSMPPMEVSLGGQGSPTFGFN